MGLSMLAIGLTISRMAMEKNCTPMELNIKVRTCKVRSMGRGNCILLMDRFMKASTRITTFKDKGFTCGQMEGSMWENGSRIKGTGKE
jgi:hypothetical protein